MSYTMNDAPITPLPSISTLFKESWSELIKRLKTFFLLGVVHVVVMVVAVAVGVGIVISSGALSAFRPNTGPGPDEFVMTRSLPGTFASVGITIGVIIVFLLIWSTVVGNAMVLVAGGNKQKGIVSYLREGLRRVGPVLLLSFLTTFFAIGGFFALVIPAFVFGFLFLFARYEVVLHKSSAMQGIQTSVRWVGAYFGPVLLRVVTYILVYLLVIFVIPGILQVAVPDLRALINVVWVIPSTVLSWFALMYLVTLYKHVKAMPVPSENRSMWWVWGITLLGYGLVLLLVFTAYTFGMRELQRSASGTSTDVIGVPTPEPTIKEGSIELDETT